MVKRLIELIRLRNSHPAFGGECAIASEGRDKIAIQWKLENQWAKLQVDLAAARATIEYTRGNDRSIISIE